MNLAVPLQFIQSESGFPVSAGSCGQNGILGMAVVGLSDSADESPWPTQWIRTPVLGGEHPVLNEFWHGSEPCRRGRFQDICFSVTSGLLFGVVSIDESSSDPGVTPLQAAAEKAYRQIFALLADQDCPHLWRVWNYVPEINRVEYGLERYRQFNIGRHQAFSAVERPVDSSPAACALGVMSGPLSIAFLAARRPAVRIENPRQVSAFVYPAKYGPRSPTFTRAALASLGHQELLFISGTASIVGHATLHVGDVVAQTVETMTNIGILLEQANLRAGVQAYSLAGLVYRVYVRHAGDYPLVRQAMERIVGPDLRAVFVQADVCREDLLVEVEAHALRRPE